MILKYQIAVQVSLTVFRIIMLVLMVATVSIAHMSGDMEFSSLTGSNNSSGDSSTSSAAASFHPDKLYILMPIAGYAYIFHHSIPSLAYPVPREHQKSLSSIFSAAVMISCAAYVAVGVVVSLYFQNNTLSPSNLNWEGYIGRQANELLRAFPIFFILRS